MLSISNPITAGGAAEYYLDMARGDYYTGNGQAPGQWFGAGAKALGLAGKVQPEVLANLLAGRSPDGTRNLVQNAGSEHRQQGWDQTFSAPKGVSAVWALAPDLRAQIEQDHNGAVCPAIDYLSDRAGKTRRGKGGYILEPASLVFAMFLETVSREFDPQLHTHAVLLNIGVRADGTTGALWSHEMFVEKMAAGAIYRAQLATNLRRSLGLIIRARRIGFDIEGVVAALCRDFSKRRRAIEAKLDEWGDHSAIAAKAATLATRPSKKLLPKEELEARWHETALSHGWTEEHARSLIGQALMEQASAQDLAKAVEAEAHRLPVRHRDREHLVRIAGRLAMELNADGTALRSFYEGILPVMLQEMSAKARAKDQEAAILRRNEVRKADDGVPLDHSAGSPRQVHPVAAATSGNTHDEEMPTTVSLDASGTRPARMEGVMSVMASPLSQAEDEQSHRPAPRSVLLSEPATVKDSDHDHDASRRGNVAQSAPRLGPEPVAKPDAARSPEKEATERSRPVRSVIHPAKSERTILQEFASKYGSAERERSEWSEAWHGVVQTSSGVPTVVRVKQRSVETKRATNAKPDLREREGKLQGQSRTWRGVVQHDAAGVPTVFRVRTARPQADQKQQWRPAPHSPERERKLVKLAKASGVFKEGASVTWSERHGGVMVRSDQGLTLVRFRPAKDVNAAKSKVGRVPLSRKLKQNLVDLVKSSGPLKQADNAYRSDSLQAVMVTSDGASTGVRLKKPFDQKEANEKFRRGFLDMLERMHPEDQTRVRVQRLAFWLGRRTGADSRTIISQYKRIIPGAEWSCLHVEARRIFTKSPVPFLNKLRIPTLAAGYPPRYWGKVRWKQDLLIGELRVQEKFLFPHSPTWSPVHKLRFPVLRFTSERARMPLKRPLKSQDAERQAPLQEEKQSKTPKQSQDRRQAMEYGY